MKIIEVTSCTDCPYLMRDKYDYCGKRFKSCPSAYHAGAYVEYSNEIPWLFKKCPLKDK